MFYVILKFNLVNSRSSIEGKIVWAKKKWDKGLLLPSIIHAGRIQTVKDRKIRKSNLTIVTITHSKLGCDEDLYKNYKDVCFCFCYEMFTKIDFIGEISDTRLWLIENVVFVVNLYYVHFLFTRLSMHSRKFPYKL